MPENDLLRVSLLQTDLYWECPEANRAMLEEWIWKIEKPTDIIILPEMFTTGFTMSPKKFAEPLNLHTHKWMRQMAEQTGAAIGGSYIVQEGGHYFNRFLWVEPSGAYSYYDKRHLFGMAGEDQHYTAGNQAIVIQWRNWRICPLICYDLRFPVWSRRRKDLDYDLLIYVANWPQPRIHAWNILLKARAIENQSYCVGVNRIGRDGYNHHYTGESAIIDYAGNELFYAKEVVAYPTVVLSKSRMEKFRQAFPFQQDADRFSILP
ncbi:MAG: amidohydrolase [Cytophagales bacterium]|nr:amidohydrolase [Bernardetiaceae bacterium]MDW8210329.1 amidohydrolase [Cytophagales bacterium]